MGTFFYNDSTLDIGNHLYRIFLILPSPSKTFPIHLLKVGPPIPSFWTDGKCAFPNCVSCCGLKRLHAVMPFYIYNMCLVPYPILPMRPQAARVGEESDKALMITKH